MTATRRLKVNANSLRYYRKVAALRLASGLTVRGRARVYRQCAPGESDGKRSRAGRRYCRLAELVDRIARVLAQAQQCLPRHLQIETTALARQLARVRKQNQKRKVRIV